ncbi:TPA: hypothetical protein ACMDXH_003361 [Vibrio parahaemolyticus]|uniref:hypothetical protein n=2 Tax=Vibrio parahaemolyticus TaxID=670 RepID=UPI00084B5F36|nr:hypothetical protein [Vibrio parahaemolyticus]EGQ8261792.1 hypothetical protein [Vibrio parahaemolyticus]EGQ8842705.1 hypothetical protein [Vibrio parahaemolyticus]EGQ9512619.1 hypothetical protein [Vibrio parahaemolyticus]EHU0317703.1 hypothetical protein [Vibrio parahaemolyticus]EJG0017554.1 hypothetical protein [Vibrio parahaemolyticus]
MTEQLNEVEEKKEVESKDKDQQLKDLLQENENALKAQRERDEKIAKLKLSMKEEALDEFEETYHNLNITPQDLAKRFGFKIAEEKEKVEPEKTKSKRKRKTPEDPLFVYVDKESGIEYHRGGSSDKVFYKEPWKGLLFDGTINDHCTLHYVTVPEYEVKVKGSVDEKVQIKKMNRKYFTKSMINNGIKLPDDKVDIERKDNKVVKDVEQMQESVRTKINQAK